MRRLNEIVDHDSTSKAKHWEGKFKVDDGAEVTFERDGPFVRLEIRDTLVWGGDDINILIKALQVVRKDLEA